MIAALRVILCAAAFGTAAQGAPSADPPTSRGITGSIVVEHAGQPLQAMVDQNLSSGVVVRVTDLTPQADAGSPHRYRIDYIGAISGTFDLREFINHRDGTPASELAPLPVTIVSELPARHGTDLFREPVPPRFSQSHYRLILGGIALLWIAVPIFVLIRRAIRNRPTQATTPEPPPPTFADQLRPFVEAAMRGGLSVAQQASLELLLLAYWSDRRNLRSLSPADAIQALRVDPEAGQLLQAVERWLHSRNPASARTPQEIHELLEPYRSSKPVELSESHP